MQNNLRSARTCYSGKYGISEELPIIFRLDSGDVETILLECTAFEEYEISKLIELYFIWLFTGDNTIIRFISMSYDDEDFPYRLLHHINQFTTFPLDVYRRCVRDDKHAYIYIELSYNLDVLLTCSPYPDDCFGRLIYERDKDEE